MSRKIYIKNRTAFFKITALLTDYFISITRNVLVVIEHKFIQRGTSKNAQYVRFPVDDEYLGN